MTTEIIITSEESQLNALTKISTEIASQCNQLVITDETSLAIAQNVLGKANDTVKSIEAMTEQLGKPYFQAHKKINQIGTAIKTPLKDAVLNGKNKIIEYDKEKRRIAAIEQQRITNIRLSIQKYSQDAIEVFKGCVTDAELVSANKIWVQEFPKDDRWGEFLNEALEMRKNIHAFAQQRRIEINAPAQADAEATAIIEEHVQEQVGEIGHEALNDLTPDKTRGMGGSWKHRVINPMLVPSEFLMVDDAKVKQYIKDNKDKMGLEASIAGIEFYFEPSVRL